MPGPIDRRAFIGAALAAPAAIGAAQAANTGPIERALRGFARLPGETAYMLRVGVPGAPWETSERAEAHLFCGSAIKTFILARYLKDIEQGRLEESARLPIDDRVRSLSSPVFVDLTGTTRTVSILEAMIAHSDNTATDIALAEVGVDRVRALVAKAGLASARIPASTRIFFSFLAGARYGVDLGWPAMERIEKGHLYGTPRSPANDRETMKCTAADFVRYYEWILGGAFLRSQAMRTEFRRISSMPRNLRHAAPPDVPIYGKGGSIEWNDFNCFCLPGQMLLRGGTVPVTFSFCVNWEGKPRTVAAVRERFSATIAETLAATAAAFG